MTTIRALAVAEEGAAPAVTDVEAPEPKASEVLVRVRAASINFYDHFVASGAMKDYASYEYPSVIGNDVAGVVEALGEGVERFEAGQRVFGTLGWKSPVHDGTFGELAVPLASELAPTPEGLSDRDAGALGVAGTTAVSAVQAIDPGEGTTVLVIGATGGVGSFAVQLAAARGATVIATVRPGDEDFVRGLGAAETVDYTADLAADVRARWPNGVDSLVDLVNRDPAAFAAVTELVRPGGIAVSAVGGAGEETSIGEVRVGAVNGDEAHLDELARLVVDGTVHVAITREFPLEQAAEALAEFVEGHTLGKFVITAG
jgi:NADPH:quinone reductase-like Zn-dependent oxidoreductase